MATVVQSSRAGSAVPTARRPGGPVNWVRRHLLQLIAGLVLVYMFLPIFVVVQFSFNRPVGKTNYDWHGFSLVPWQTICSNGLCGPLGLSLKIGLISTLVSTVLGTLVAFSLSRYRFAGRSAANLLIFLPMATPEVVMGSSLLTLFVNLTVIPQGFWTITIAHVMFCLSFVVVTVKARIAGLDSRLEEAAMDLYADERTTFLKVTFPLVLPGIVGVQRRAGADLPAVGLRDQPAGVARAGQRGRLGHVLHRADPGRLRPFRGASPRPGLRGARCEGTARGPGVDRPVHRGDARVRPRRGAARLGGGGLHHPVLA
jgi:spermidine/putrescine transport system permease protein